MIEFNKSHPDFKSIYWVCLALADKKHSRVPLRYLHVFLDDLMSQVQFTASDGHRLHRFTAEGPEMHIPGGLYSIVNRNKTQVIIEKETDDGIVYPDVNRVIPEFRSTREATMEAFTQAGPISSNYATALRMLAGQDWAIDMDYFKDLTALDAPVFDLKTSARVTRAYNGAITVETTHHYGVLMGSTPRGK